MVNERGPKNSDETFIGTISRLKDLKDGLARSESNESAEAQSIIDDVLVFLAHGRVPDNDLLAKIKEKNPELGGLIEIYVKKLEKGEQKVENDSETKEQATKDTQPKPQKERGPQIILDPKDTTYFSESGSLADIDKKLSDVDKVGNYDSDYLRLIVKAVQDALQYDDIETVKAETYKLSQSLTNIGDLRRTVRYVLVSEITDKRLNAPGLRKLLVDIKERLDSNDPNWLNPGELTNILSETHKDRRSLMSAKEQFYSLLRGFGVAREVQEKIFLPRIKDAGNLSELKKAIDEMPDSKEFDLLAKTNVLGLISQIERGSRPKIGLLRKIPDGLISGYIKSKLLVLGTFFEEDAQEPKKSPERESDFMNTLGKVTNFDGLVALLGQISEETTLKELGIQPSRPDVYLSRIREHLRDGFPINTEGMDQDNPIAAKMTEIWNREKIDKEAEVNAFNNKLLKARNLESARDIIMGTGMLVVLIAGGEHTSKEVYLNYINYLLDTDPQKEFLATMNENDPIKKTLDDIASGKQKRGFFDIFKRR